MVESVAVTLIEASHVRHDRLSQELITLSELEAAAHKQEFASLDEVERSELEPGGALIFVAKKPTVESRWHDEIPTRLDEIGRRLDTLQSAR